MQIFCRSIFFFEVLTNHKPLKAIYCKDLRDVTNTRIHNFREKTVHCNFTVKWVQGKLHFITDALSRARIPGTFIDKEPPGEHFIVQKIANVEFDIARDDFVFCPLLKAAQEGKEYQSIIEAIKIRKEFKALPKDHPGREYHIVWDHLAIIDDKPNPLLVYDSNKVVVPKKDPRWKESDQCSCGQGCAKTFSM